MLFFDESPFNYGAQVPCGDRGHDLVRRAICFRASCKFAIGTPLLGGVSFCTLSKILTPKE